MATTTQGIPYPVGTDRVMDGDNVMAGIAQWVDDNTCFAAGYLTTGEGPGVGGSRWFGAITTIGLGGGTTTVPDLTNGSGFRVPRKGFYHVLASAEMTFSGPPSSASYATLFLGTNPTQWAFGTVQCGPSPAIDHHVQVQTVVQLAANTIVRWGMQASGPQASGTNGGSARSLLMVRLLVQLP